MLPTGGAAVARPAGNFIFTFALTAFAIEFIPYRFLQNGELVEALTTVRNGYIIPNKHEIVYRKPFPFMTTTLQSSHMKEQRVRPSRERGIGDKLKTTAIRMSHQLEMIRSEDLHAAAPLAYTPFEKPMAGTFYAAVMRAEFSYDDGDTFWTEYDPRININVPPLMRGALRREKFDEAGHQLARYIAYNGLHTYEELRIVGGATHAAFGAMAVRAFGFKRADIDPNKLPLDAQQRTVELAQMFGDERVGKRAGPVFVYQDIEAVIGRYIDRDPQLEQWHDAPPVDLRFTAPFL